MNPGPGGWLEVTSGTPQRDTTLLAHYTEVTKSDVLFSTTNHMYLEFHPNISHIGWGLNFTYQSG